MDFSLLSQAVDASGWARGRVRGGIYSGEGISPSTNADIIYNTQSFALEPQAQVVNVEVREWRMCVIWVRRWATWCGLLVWTDLVSTDN